MKRQILSILDPQKSELNQLYYKAYPKEMSNDIEGKTFPAFFEGLLVFFSFEKEKKQKKTLN